MPYPALPKPLPREEEAQLINALGGGSHQQIKNILVERNLRLVVHIAKKYMNTGIDSDDLFSIGAIGLIKAVNTFKPDKKIRLATYASRCIANEILMYMRRSKHMGREMSMDEAINVDKDGRELRISDILGTDADETTRSHDATIMNGILEDALGTLKNLDRRVIEMRFGVGRECERFTQLEISNRLGVSQSYISRIEKKACVILRKEMERVM